MRPNNEQKSIVNAKRSTHNGEERAKVILWGEFFEFQNRRFLASNFELVYLRNAFVKSQNMTSQCFLTF